MSIIDELASSLNQRGGEANKAVAEKCVHDVRLLNELMENISTKNLKILGDICEVMTETAKLSPEIVVPFIRDMYVLTKHKNGRIQWESMHTVSLTAIYAESFIQSIIPDLMSVIRVHTGVILRDYAVDTIACYAGISPSCAETAYPYLKECLSLWDGKHAVKVMTGLTNVLTHLPEKKDEILSPVSPLVNHPTGTVQKAAKKLLKLCKST